MKIYLDTTCWYRPFENANNAREKNEQDAITALLDMSKNIQDGIEIVSSKMQVNQLYSKRNHKDTLESDKKVIQQIIELLQYCTGTATERNPPHVNEVLGCFLSYTQLPDVEDARHILSAWLLECDFFVTTDYSSILNINDHHQIEKFTSRLNPISNNVFKLQIREPVSFLKEISRH